MIVVVGAGVAGVAAAISLVKEGKKVIILQSGNKAGGRLSSKKIELQTGGQFIFEEGGNWIHGSSKKNPITLLADQIGLIRAETIDDSQVILSSKGKQVQQESQRSFDIYEQLLEQSQNHKGKDVSFQQFVALKNPKLLQDPFFMHFASIDLEFQSSGDVESISASMCYSDQEIQGTQELVLSGYSNLVQTLIQKYSLDVRLQSKVTSITFDGEVSYVKTRQGQIYEAESVILAVPIGVLKAEKIKFQPELEEKKTELINRIGFGNVCKVLLQFKQQVWNIKQHYISVVSPQPENRGLCTYFLNLTAFCGKPLIMTFGLGCNADQVEQMPQEELRQIITQRINCFSDRTIDSQQFNLYRSQWRSHSDFGGAYTYPTVGFSFKDWKQLVRPEFSKKWYFAGQYCTLRYRGTVHGAWLSGQKAARDILKGQSQDRWSFIDNKWWNES